MAKVNYKIIITPNQASFVTLALWLPVSYDHVFEEIKIIPKPVKLGREDKFGNKMAYFEFEKEEVRKNLIIEEKFELKKSKDNFSISDFKLSDYDRDEDYKKYIAADNYLQSSSLVIQKVADVIKSSSGNLKTVVKEIYNYILSILQYGYPTIGLYTSLQAFDFRMVDCGGFSTLFSALCQAVGVPSRVVAGFMAKNARNSGYHAWSEFMLPDKQWIPVDLAMAKLTGRNYFGKTYEERIIFCKGTDFSLIPELPDKEKASILQMYYLRLNKGAELNDLKVKTQTKVSNFF